MLIVIGLVEEATPPVSRIVKIDPGAYRVERRTVIGVVVIESTDVLKVIYMSVISSAWRA